MGNGERLIVLGMGSEQGSVIGNCLDPKSQLSGSVSRRRGTYPDKIRYMKEVIQ